MIPPTWILGSACAFPSGPNIALADAAVRARLGFTRDHPSYLDMVGAPVRVSRFPSASHADEALSGAQRWGWLTRHALAQLTQALTPWWSRLVDREHWLWLVLPDDRRPDLPDALETTMREAVTHALWPWSRISIVTGGHAAGLVALAQAQEAIRTPPADGRPAPLAVVLAAEAATDHASLGWLDAQHLLHGAHIQSGGGPRRQKHGRMPGEGAAAVALLADSSTIGAPPAAPWARLLGCGLGLETRDRHSAQPCVGEGLSAAAQSAFAQAGDALPPVATIYTDLNGEPYRGDEFGFTALRLGPRLSSHWERCAPALASADLHSASGLAHVALSSYQLQRARTQAAHLVLASSDDAARGAALLGPALANTPSLPPVHPWR